MASFCCRLFPLWLHGDGDHGDDDGDRITRHDHAYCFSDGYDNDDDDDGNDGSIYHNEGDHDDDEEEDHRDDDDGHVDDDTVRRTCTALMQ